MFSTPLRVCDCRTRVLRLYEDGAANVAALGSSLCVIPRVGGVKYPPMRDGDPVAFVNGELITVQNGPSGVTLRLSAEMVIDLPISECAVFDSSHDLENESVFVLTTKALLEINLAGSSAAVLGEWEESEGKFEKVVASKSFAAAYRYGLMVYERRAVAPLDLLQDRPYSAASFVSETRLVAADTLGNVDLIDLRGSCEPKTLQLNGDIVFLGEIDGRPIAVYEQDSIRYCRTLWGDPCISTPIGSFGCEAFEVVQDRYLAIGTIEGAVLLWDATSGQLQRVSLEEPQRIVEMLWSRARSELFLGTRGGEVYVSHPD
jgi:hypothetical protein